MSTDTQDPRWTYETADAVRSVLTSWGVLDGDREKAADEILAALADAGLLLPAGGELRTEWGIGWTAPDTALDPGPRVNGYEFDSYDDGGESEARRCVAWHVERGDMSTHVVHRTVHTTPWQPADTNRSAQ